MAPMIYSFHHILRNEEKSRVGDVKLFLFLILLFRSFLFDALLWILEMNLPSVCMQQVFQVSEKTVLEQKAYMLFYVRDRRNTAPKNSVDILQRDNVKASVDGKSIFNQNPGEHVQTGPIQNKLSAAVPQKDIINGGLSKETIMKEVPSQQNNVQLMEEGLVLKKEAILPSFDLPLLKDSSKASASNLIHGENLQPSAGSVVGNVASSNIENPTVSTGAKDSYCNESGNCKREFGVPVMVPQNCGGLLKSCTDKIVTKETLQKINLASNIEVSNTVTLDDSIDKAVKKTPGEASKNVHVIRSPNKPHCDSNKIGDVSYHSSRDKSLKEKGDDNSQKTISRSPSSMPNGSLETEDPEFVPCRKSKKKHLKRKPNNMPLGLKSKFFMASLLMHGKKKRKRCKEKDCCSLDLGPTTCEKFSTITLGSVHGRKRTADDTTQRNADNSASSLMNTVDVASKERICENGTVLATDQHLGSSSGSVSEANRHNSRETDSLKHSKTGASPHRPVLTQCLGEAIVPRWDDIGLTSPMQTAESNGMDGLEIGYVPDEWDEEYDRGKRKKIRQNKHQFGGPNPFQQIATKKTQLKKAKLDRSSSGNRPFRI
ncbi:ubiquitin carboxyl-terminal hydrolase 23 [Gossypium australe]|uniref:Ubiquitin carboxyl-terminal hydrolase 23 n=1 Tax=Gossypium australe TaxID=47621 RepID=A0A5B6X8K1_9ROSI|nr:ubiquitin carboxyl-terminal hydrolase 23 [Gossypium australe]